MNKDNKNNETENRVITPKLVFQAFDYLPHDYVKQVEALLSKWCSEGKINRTYSERYIIKVRQGEKDAFNKHVAEALVEVGLANKELLESYGRMKKAPVNN